MQTLREVLPLPPEELAGVAAAVSSQLASIHADGRTHGAVSLDAVLIDQGRVQLASGPETGTQAEDIAALGRLVAAAMQRSGRPPRAARAAVSALAAAAVEARRAATDAKPPLAADLVSRFARAVPGARLPRLDATSGSAAGPRHAVEVAPRKRAAVLAAWIAFLAVSLAALSLVGGSLAAPPLLRGAHAVSLWAAERDAGAIAVSVIRLVALVLGWYLLGSTLVSVVAHATRYAAALRFADALTAPSVRRLVQATVGATLAGSALVISTSAPTPSSAMVMRRMAPADDVTMVRLDESPTPSRPPAPSLAPAVQVPPATATATATATASLVTSPGTTALSVAREWTVQPGDHLWRIAERVLGSRTGREPTDHETDPFWRRLVAANHDRLADPANPDLIFPGQVLVVPD